MFHSQDGSLILSPASEDLPEANSTAGSPNDRSEATKRPVLVPLATSIWATMLICAVCVCVQWVRVRDTYFVFDDFLFTRIAQASPFGLTLLRRPLFEHFSPMLWVASKLIVGPLGMSHAAAVAIGLSVSAFSIGCVHRLALRWCKSPGTAAVLAILYGTSIMVTTILRWWTTSVHANLCAAMSLGCLLCFVRYRESGRRLDANLSVTFFAVALLTHEKAFLVPGYLVLLWATVDATAWHPRNVLDELRQHRWLWSAYLVLGVAGLLNFYVNYYLDLESAGPVDVAIFVWRSFTTSFTPAFFGIRYPQVGGFLGIWVKIAVVAGFAIAAFLTIRRSRHAIRGWVFLLVTLGVNFFVVGQARAALYGAGSYSGLQYQQEVAFLFPLGIAIIAKFTPAMRSSSGGVDRRVGLRRGAMSAAALAILFLPFAVVAGRSNDVVEREFDAGEQSKRYLALLRSDVDRYTTDGIPPSVLHAEVPDAWMAAVFAPWNSVGNVAAVMRIPLVIGLHGVDQQMYAVAADGGLTPYELGNASSLELGTASLLRGERSPSDPRCAVMGPDGTAYVRVEAPPAARSTRPADLGFLARVDAQSDLPFELLVLGGFETVETLSDSAYFPVGGGLFDVGLEAAEFDHLDILISASEPGAVVCIRDITLGSAVPTG